MATCPMKSFILRKIWTYKFHFYQGLHYEKENDAIQKHAAFQPVGIHHGSAQRTERKIVEETGFKGIWGSGLSISAALGVRDNNEASWTQSISS
ncbi:MAG: hypothetical protein R3C26_20190 [Calditrichia bacterium]